MHRLWKQGQGTWKEYRDATVQGRFRKAKIQLELKLARDVKNNNDFLQICQPEKTGQRKLTKLATVQEEKINITLPQSLMAAFLPISLQWMGYKAGTLAAKSFPL